MYRLLLSCVLLSGLLNALHADVQKEMDSERQKDFNLAMYVEAPYAYASNGPPNSPSSSGHGGSSTPSFASAVVIQGWTATATTGTTTGNATDIYSCLDACRTVTSIADPRCRFVSYNIETYVCTKFLKMAATTGKLAFSRNTDMQIAAFSDKRFTLINTTDFYGDDLAPIPVAGTGNAEFCKLFCHIHPTCNVAMVNNAAGWGNCYLKSKTSLNGVASAASTAYIS